VGAASVLKLLGALSGGWVGPAIAAAVLALAAAWHFGETREAREEGRAEERVLRDAERARYAAAAASATADNLAEERRRQAALQKEIDHATTALDAARRDADAAGRAAAGLLDAARHAAARCRQAPANPALAASSPSTEGGLLAEVLGELDDEAGRLAAEADRRGIAGTACESAYDNLNQVKESK
jgi:hypothetical protein